MHIIDNAWVVLIIYFFRKKPDMKFIILVSNLAFSPEKKGIYKKKTTMQFYCQKTIQPKKDTKLCLSSFLCQCFCSSTIRFVPYAHFLHQQTISHMGKRFPEWVHCQVAWILRGSTLNSLLDASKSNSDVFPSF